MLCPLGSAAAAWVCCCCVPLALHSQQGPALPSAVPLPSLCPGVSQLVPFSPRLRNGVKYCKVLRLPEVRDGPGAPALLPAAPRELGGWRQDRSSPSAVAKCCRRPLPALR